jgi:hypothetical protein
MRVQDVSWLVHQFKPLSRTGMVETYGRWLEVLHIAKTEFRPDYSRRKAKFSSEKQKKCWQTAQRNH